MMTDRYIHMHSIGLQEESKLMNGKAREHRRLQMATINVQFLSLFSTQCDHLQIDKYRVPALVGHSL